ncbi:hypothetical protein BCR32DRAFT_291046 [Anaeromyces robustus]|uniref:Protein PNS1 n=1 Tax=Anaeromyces robustus TaxID=1754192 RepID=A0A1Y1XGK1_9FUNG|nr:hypothetical protein BCR32DRAFT_291046 [Anaeromyces robustus]|eukprot:ORX84881.1 hypothetical protein BCR32DRAFT_291046 [Anaeromyces robustus]
MDSDCNSLEDSVNILNSLEDSVNINDNIEENTKISENEIINSSINIYEVENNINVNLEKNSKSSKTSINDDLDKNLIISEREVINNGLNENINIYEEENNVNVNLEKNSKSSKTSINDDLDKNLVISEREVINNGLNENINIYEEENNVNVNLEKNITSKLSIIVYSDKNSKILKTAILDDDLDKNLKISKTSLKDSKLSITSINNSSIEDLKYIPPKDRKIHDIWGISIYIITTSLMFFLYIQSISVLQLYGMPDKESFYVELFNSITDDDSGNIFKDNTSETMINEKNLSFINQKKYYNDYEYYNYNIYNNSLNYIDISYNNNNLNYNNSLNYMEISYNNNLNYNYLLSSNDNNINNYINKKENNYNEQQPKNGNNEMEQPKNTNNDMEQPMNENYDKEEEIKKELENENNEEISIESEEIKDSKSLIIILYLISVSSTFVVACIYLSFLLFLHKILAIITVIGIYSVGSGLGIYFFYQWIITKLENKIIIISSLTLYGCLINYLIVNTLYAIVTYFDKTTTEKDKTKILTKRVNLKEVFYILVILFLYFYNNEVLKNLIHTIVSGVIYYTFFDNYINFNPVIKSLSNSVIKNLGSICIGSILAAVIRVLDGGLKIFETLFILPMFIKNKLKSVCCFFKIIGHILYLGIIGIIFPFYFIILLLEYLIKLIELAMKYFNFYTFTNIAMEGKSYLKASVDTFSIVNKYKNNALINDYIIRYLLLAGQYFIISVGVVITKLTADYIGIEKSNIIIYVTGITLIFKKLFASITQSVLSSTVAIFVVFIRTGIVGKFERDIEEDKKSKLKKAAVKSELLGMVKKGYYKLEFGSEGIEELQDLFDVYTELYGDPIDIIKEYHNKIVSNFLNEQLIKAR